MVRYSLAFNGGFDLAAQWMGWDNVAQCEIDPFCQQVLKYHWPNARLHKNVRTTDFTIYNGKIDIITGGFPCQPFSTAGKRLGKEDDRHLWPEMLRAIREISPRWIVGENVRGLLNWNEGVVFNEVQADLEAEGYEVLPFLLPAAGVGAPHRRDRIWFVAFNSDSKPYGADNTQKGEGTWMELERHVMGSPGWKKGANYIDTSGGYGITPNSRNNGCKRSYEFAQIDNRWLQKGLEKRHELESLHGYGHASHAHGFGRKRRNCETQRQHAINGNAWSKFPTQSPVCSRDDGLPSELDGITFSKWINESIKGYGNAVVVPLVYQIFKSIEAYERIHGNNS